MLSETFYLFVLKLESKSKSVRSAALKFIKMFWMQTSIWFQRDKQFHHSLIASIPSVILHSKNILLHKLFHFIDFRICLFLNCVAQQAPSSLHLKTIFDFTLIRFIPGRVVIKMCNSRFLLARKESLTSPPCELWDESQNRKIPWKRQRAKFKY